MHFPKNGKSTQSNPMSRSHGNAEVKHATYWNLSLVRNSGRAWVTYCWNCIARLTVGCARGWRDC